MYLHIRQGASLGFLLTLGGCSWFQGEETLKSAEPTMTYSHGANYAPFEDDEAEIWVQDEHGLRPYHGTSPEEIFAELAGPAATSRPTRSMQFGEAQLESRRDMDFSSDGQLRGGAR